MPHRLAFLAVLLLATPLPAADAPASTPKVPDGYTIELVAGSPLVEHPMFAEFDEKGRLFIAEAAGKNLERKKLDVELPNLIRMIEDTNNDGVFDKSTIYADKLTFPQGVLCLDGSVYCASSGALWKFTDTDSDGVADKREKILGDFGYTGNAADVKGPFLGPDGRLYVLEGRHGHHFKDKDGKTISKGKAGRIFSCKTDGSDVRSFCAGGFDNPVEIVFTDEGDMLGTVNLMYHQPRGDCLVHWVYGGVYPRTDFLDQLKGEFYFTGDPLPEVHNFGHVALSGLCRYRSEHFGLKGVESKGAASPPLPPRERSAESARPGEGEAPNPPQTFAAAANLHLFITEFNTHKIKHVTLARSGSTYKADKVEDFLTSDSIDFHPTDVLEDADGSLLAIDTGGWFRIGCPVSQVEKPQIKGAIWRIRRKGGKAYEDPRGAKIDWRKIDFIAAHALEDDPRPAVRERAVRLRPQVFPHRIPTKALSSVVQSWRQSGDKLPLGTRRALVEALRKEGVWDAGQAVSVLVEILKRSDNDRYIEHSIITALIELADSEATAKSLNSDNERVRRGAAIALEQMRRKLTLTDDKPEGVQVPPPQVGAKLSKDDLAKLDAVEPLMKSGEAASGKTIFFSQKASCAVCHRVGDQGAEVSLNLTKIGAIRSERDLLESILFPSATFARGFEPFTVTTKEGEIHTGLISRETAEAIHLRNGNNQETKVMRDAIDKIEAGKVSIMPANYGDLLSKQELADLIAYLRSLK